MKTFVIKYINWMNRAQNIDIIKKDHINVILICSSSPFLPDCERKRGMIFIIYLQMFILKFLILKYKYLLSIYVYGIFKNRNNLDIF